MDSVKPDLCCKASTESVNFVPNHTADMPVLWRNHLPQEIDKEVLTGYNKVQSQLIFQHLGNITDSDIVTFVVIIMDNTFGIGST